MTKSIMSAGINRNAYIDKVISKENRKFFRSIDRTTVCWKAARKNQYRTH